MRPLVLDTLQGGPRHGYEIIKSMEERSGGRYNASPGSIYPTLQFLEEAGLITAVEGAEPRSFQLTDTGRDELAARKSDIDAFWTRFATPDPPAAVRAESRFFHEDFELFSRTLWNSVHEATARGDHKTLRKLRAALQTCRDEIRTVVAEAIENETIDSEPTDG